MYGPTQAQSGTQPSIPRIGASPKRNFRKATTAEVRAFLSDLKTLPHSHRRLLCRLLRRAAAQATGKVSVVHPADPHLKKKP